MIDSFECIIRPEGFTIALGAAKVHGITQARAKEEGVSLLPILKRLSKAIEIADIVVAHNVSFDEKIVGAEFIRANMPNVLTETHRRCTMKESTDYCRIPGNYGYKWPKLTELHVKLFDEPFDGAHGAMADCSACMRCFFELQEQGAIS